MPYAPNSKTPNQAEKKQRTSNVAQSRVNIIEEGIPILKYCLRSFRVSLSY
jgi:hypothetical protein